eukprot:Nitzschia sp. Nitz4//scaffold22_size323478//96755//97609//NITZ4_000517-RA/size323478-processed-gene-0.83-mRNA-1//-1//CDS//3329542965//8863//frame0
MIVNSKNEELRSINGDSGSPIRFSYYTKKLPKFLSSNPSGNLLMSQSMGMELIQLDPADYKALFGGDWGGSALPPEGLPPPLQDQSLWVPQGVACTLAARGALNLAKEIYKFWVNRGNGMSLSVVIPGGTCSTGFLVHHALKKIEQTTKPLDIDVVVVPCVGDEGYAYRQMQGLKSQLGEQGLTTPLILPASPASGQHQTQQGYFSFARPHKEVYQAFSELQNVGVPVDLIYGASAWAILFRHLRQADHRQDSFFAVRSILYVHSGGLEGVDSQLQRYQHAGLI